MKNKIVIFFLSFLMFACATTHQSKTIQTTKEKYDSIVYIEKVRIDTFRVSADTATIKISQIQWNDTVWKYIEKSDGRAKVVIQRVNDTVYISGYCDSIYKLFINIDKTAFKQQLQTDNNKTIIQTKKTNKLSRWIVIIGALMLIILLVIKIINPLK